MPHGSVLNEAGQSAKIGESVGRIEDDALLRGRATFIDDVDVGPGVLHVGFLRSPHAHANIVNLDVTKAQNLPFVERVLTAADFVHIQPICADFEETGFTVVGRPALASKRVRFVGDLIAMVFARDPYTAADAIEAIEVDYEPLACVTRAEEAVRSTVRLFDEAPDNVLYRGAFESPGFDEAHKAAELHLTERFTADRIAAVSMEPRGCIARFDKATGELILWSSTQSPHMVRSVISEYLALPENKVRVIAADIGGGFGAKTVVYPEEILVSAAAQLLGFPVKWIQDRYEDLLTSAQAREHIYEVEVGFDGNGILRSLSADILVNLGAYPSLPLGSSLEANGAPRNMPGPYTLRNFRYRTRAVTTNTCPTGPYRGVSAPLACFAVEGMLDRIAHRLKLDPAEVRRRNLISEFPYTNILGQVISEGCFGPAFERALEGSGYAALRRRQAENKNPDIRYGVGVAVITEQTGMGASRYKARGILRVPGFESAHVKLEPDGTLTAAISQTAIGQGNATAFAQIMSDVVGASFSDIRIVCGDTGRTPEGSGTLASRGITIAGNAALIAAGKIREKMARIAAHMIECDPADIRFENGHAHVVGVKDMRVSLKQIAGAAYSKSRATLPAGESYGLEATEYYDTPTAVIASMVHIASVAIDARTGNVQVDRYFVIHDCGRLVNPMLVDGQIQGAVVQGLGEVLMESIEVGFDGQPSTVSLMDYQLPRAIDVMPMEIEAMHSEEGAKVLKGVGEGGTIGAVPALASAIANALGYDRISANSLPLTAKKIRDLIAASEAS